MMNRGVLSFERVWWPLIPREIVADAEAITSMLADPAARSAFFDRLPTKTKPGTVVIRHSRWRDKPFVAFAAYDVQDGAARRHFDINAGELFLPGENVATPPSTGSLLPPTVK